MTNRTTWPLLGAPLLDMRSISGRLHTIVQGHVCLIGRVQVLSIPDSCLTPRGHTPQVPDLVAITSRSNARRLANAR